MPAKVEPFYVSRANLPEVFRNEYIRNVKTVISCNAPSEAAVVGSLLKSEGVDVFVPQENTPQPLSGFPAGQHIQVADEFYGHAMLILKATGYLAPKSTGLGERHTHGRRLALFRWLLLIDAALAIGI